MKISAILKKALARMEKNGRSVGCYARNKDGKTLPFFGNDVDDVSFGEAYYRSKARACCPIGAIYLSVGGNYLEELYESRARDAMDYLIEKGKIPNAEIADWNDKTRDDQRVFNKFRRVIALAVDEGK